MLHYITWNYLVEQAADARYAHQLVGLPSASASVPSRVTRYRVEDFDAQMVCSLVIRECLCLGLGQSVPDNLTGRWGWPRTMHASTSPL